MGPPEKRQQNDPNRLQLFILCSPVFVGNIAKYGHVLRISAHCVAEFLCSYDCVAEEV